MVHLCEIILLFYFSSLPSSSEAPTVVTGGSFFSWGTKFRYSGRVEREIMEDLGPLRREEPPINRSRPPSLRRKASSVPATPSTPVGSDIGEISKHSFLFFLIISIWRVTLFRQSGIIERQTLDVYTTF